MSDFDFIKDEENEIATGGNLDEDAPDEDAPDAPDEISILAKEYASMPERRGRKEPEPEQPVLGALTPEIIAEARKLAESPKGLDINPFFTKHHLTCNIDRLLHGKLDKDGNLI